MVEKHLSPSAVVMGRTSDQLTSCCLSDCLCAVTILQHTQHTSRVNEILIEFEWNGLKVSEVDNLENRKFLEGSHLNL